MGRPTDKQKAQAADGILTQFWIDHYLTESTFEAPGVCCLCGNVGVVDTRGTATTPTGISVGRLEWCLCPNGRALRRTFKTSPTALHDARKRAAPNGAAGEPSQPPETGQN